jgi:hypothetical protein
MKDAKENLARQLVKKRAKIAMTTTAIYLRRLKGSKKAIRAMCREPDGKRLAEQRLIKLKQTESAAATCGTIPSFAPTNRPQRRSRLDAVLPGA